MARHRQDVRPDHPSGPLPRVPTSVGPADPAWGAASAAPVRRGRHRSGDPETTPLDLAAIALAAAGTRTGALAATSITRTADPTATAARTVAPGTAPVQSPADVDPEPASHRSPSPPRPAAHPRGGCAGAGRRDRRRRGGRGRGRHDAGRRRRPRHRRVRATRSGPGRPGLERRPRGRDSRPDDELAAYDGPAPQHRPRARDGRRAPDDGGRTLWSADFASAGLDNFKSTPWNNQGASSPRVAGGSLDVTMPGGGKRSEVEPDFRQFDEGDDYYVGFSVRLDDDFPVDTSDWQVITQFKNEGTGSPPLEIKVQDGQFILDGGGGAFARPLGAAVPGQWTHLALHVTFASDDGTVSAWQDGRQTLANYAPPGGTLYDGLSSYLKIGIYRNSSIETPGRLSFGSYAIGTSLGSVARDASAD